MNVQLHNPDHILDCRNMNSPVEIYEYFKKHKINKYVYCIKVGNKTAKIGKSGKENKRPIWGERVQGQMAQLDGWIWATDQSFEVGKDFRRVAEDLKITDKDQYILHIWDLTNEYNPTVDPDYLISKAEAELLKQACQIEGRMYKGNKKYEKIKGAPLRSVADALFSGLTS